MDERDGTALYRSLAFFRASDVAARFSCEDLGRSTPALPPDRGPLHDADRYAFLADGECSDLD